MKNKYECNFFHSIDSYYFSLIFPPKTNINNRDPFFNSLSCSIYPSSTNLLLSSISKSNLIRLLEFSTLAAVSSITHHFIAVYIDPKHYLKIPPLQIAFH